MPNTLTVISKMARLIQNITLGDELFILKTVDCLSACNVENECD
jgi:hypothetical protein